MPNLADRIVRLPADTVACLGFFSRIPAPSEPTIVELRTASGAWPLAGLVMALGPAIVLVACRGAGMPEIVSAALAIAALVAITGALHEDGLADTVDGFGGGSDKAGKREIMRDSRIGGYGVLALVLALVVKIAALAAIAASAWPAALGLVGTAVVSRALALWYWQATGPASPEGLAAEAGRPDVAALTLGLGTGAILLVVLLVQFGGAALFAAALAVLGVVAFARLCHRQIGGHSGDTIGAAQQIAETLLLAGLSTGLAA